MPKAPLHDALARQWELLRAIPGRRPGQTAGELMKALDEAGFAVTKRTIERDLIGLSRQFGIACEDQAKPYRWYWIEGKSLELPGLGTADALCLSLVEDLLVKLLPAPMLRVLGPRFEEARKKLGATDGNRYAAWTNRVRYVPPTLPFLAPKVPKGVLEAVHQAILEERRLLVRYCGFTDAKPKELTLSPLAFVQHGPVPYLIATAFGYTDPRLYALQRIVFAKLAAEPATPPEGFTLDGFLKGGGMQFGDGGMIDLRAVVSRELACYLAESPIAEGQALTPQAGDRYLLKVRVRDSWMLDFWLLSQGPAVEVLKPANLRRKIRNRLQEALRNYRTS